MSAPPCMILNDDELAQIDSPMAWRNTVSTMNMSKIFSSEATQFPVAFQTFKVGPNKAFPFKVVKKKPIPVVKRASPPLSGQDGALIDTVRAMFAEDDYPYAPITPPKSPTTEYSQAPKSIPPSGD